MEAFVPLDTIMPQFMEAGRSSNDFLGEVANGFWLVIAWSAIFWAALRVTTGASSLEGSGVHLAGWFLRIYLLGTVCAMLLPTILPALISGAFGIGSGMSGGRLTAADFLLPSKLFFTGWREVEILMKHAMSRWNPVTIFYYLLASVGILFSFGVMIGMVILSYVYFIMEAAGVVISIMFGGSDKTAWMGRGGPAALVNRFMQLVMMSGVLSIGLVVLDGIRLAGEPTITQAVVAAIVSIIIAVGVLKSEQMGASVIGGMPGPTTGGTSSAAFAGVASFLGAGIGAAGQLARGALPGGGDKGPSAPPPRDPVGSPRGPQGGPGNGHGDDPFGPSQVGEKISAHARTLPKGSGEGAEAPTRQQWQDASIMGTDIVGMTRSQAAAALDAHQNYFMSRGAGTDAVPPSSHAAGANGPKGVSAPPDWMTPSQPGTARTGGAWDGPPSPKQHRAAEKYGVDLGGMTKGQASLALEQAGMDASWYNAAPRSGGGGASPGWMPKDGSASAPVVYPPAGPKAGLGGSLSSSNPGERPLMRSAAGATVRRTFSPKSGGTGHQVALNNHRNDGRFRIGDEQLSYVGQGGGEGGTGYRPAGWQQPSIRKTAIPALSGQGYWQRRDAAAIKQIHMGVTPRPPRAPKSAAATI